MTRICLVTGAASGLGEATSLVLLAKGWQVAGLDLPGKFNKDTQDPPGFHRFEADITDESAVSKVLETIGELEGEMRGVVHCAGVAFATKTLGSRGPHSASHFEWVVGINLVGTFQIVRLSAEQMAQNTPDEDGGRGCIITTSSIAAFDGQKGQVAYAATKGAVASMVLPMARDLASYGIRVMGIAPGVFETPMMQLLPEEKKAKLAAQVPFPSRLGKPSEYGELAHAILENGLLNGEVIRLDGALRLP